MSIKKQYLKSRPVCKVTFVLPKEKGNAAETAHVVGEFNNWDLLSNPMKKLKSGQFKVTIDLEPGRDYQFRYVLDGLHWENDTEADRYVPSPYGDSDNSVIAV